MNPKVSIIIPNYNHATFLKQRLDSVFNQTYTNFEVILLDDASTDGSHELLKQYSKNPKVSDVVINKENSGSPFKQWKKGIELAKGEYIWIAESDDYCETFFLERMMNGFLNGADICYSQSSDVNTDGTTFIDRISYTAEFKPNIWRNDFTMNGNEFNNTYLLIKNVIPNASAVVFKRRIVDSVFFDSTLLSMKMCGDWLFWMRLCNNNKIAFFCQSLNYFRNHDAISRTHNTLEKQKLRLQEESALRREVYQNLGIRNRTQEELLFGKWFKLHGFLKVFTKNFYTINLLLISSKSLFLKFVFLKLKNRF